MLILERPNNLGPFIAIPKVNGWVFIAGLRFADDYRWVSPQMRLHLGREDGGNPKLSNIISAMRSFKSMEKQVVDEGYIGWIAHTSVTNNNMIKLFLTLGGEAYKVDPTHHVWFCRRKDSIVNSKVGLVRKLENKKQVSQCT